MQGDAHAHRPWWREPMVWLVIALPLGAVAASAYLIGESIRTHATFDDVPDRVRRTAQVQQADIGPDERAAQLKLSAVVEVSAGSVSVREVGTGMDHGAALVVNFSHPFEKAHDHVVQLQPSASGWRGVASIPTSNDWNIRLQPLDAQWRIGGRMRAGNPHATLTSNLAR